MGSRVRVPPRSPNILYIQSIAADLLINAGTMLENLMSIYLTPAERFEINDAIERVMNDEDRFPASAGRFLIKAIPVTPKPSFFQMRGKYKI